MPVIAFPVPTLAEVVGWGTAPGVTETEAAIVQGLADGRTEALIGINLCMSREDVHAAVSHLMLRLDRPTPAALVARLLRAGRIR